MPKKIIRLTESDLINLIGKIIKEQSYDESAFEEHMGTIEHIANHFDRETTEDELDFLLTQIEYELDSAVRGDELTDDELEELHEYANDIARELEMEFMSNNDLHEGTKTKKPKSMRSKRSGVKTQKTINQNHEILKKLVKEELEYEDEEEKIRPSLDRQLNHSDPDDFTVIGRIKVVQNPPAKTPNFILLSNNKTLSGTRLLNGVELMGYEDKIVKLTGITRNGEHPSWKNPMKVTKRPQILSTKDPTY